MRIQQKASVFSNLQIRYNLPSCNLGKKSPALGPSHQKPHTGPHPAMPFTMGQESQFFSKWMKKSWISSQ